MEIKLRKIIHIGLGKTATTHLQVLIFQELDRLGILHYRKDLVQKINRNILNQKVFSESKQIKLDLELDKFPDDAIHLISMEYILPFDPGCWKTSLISLLSDFGEDSEILVTLRDPYSYLRSVYQQMIHEGESDLEPERYFLKSDLYIKHLEYFGRSNENRRFSVDELDYGYLFNSLTKMFRRVYFSDIKTTMDYQFLIDMNIIDSPTCEELRKKNVLKVLNKGYSKKAMLLDRKRYKMLNSMNLIPKSTSIISRNICEQLIFSSPEIVEEISNETPSISNKKVSLAVNNLKKFLKEFRIIRVLLKIAKLPYVVFIKWRFFLQGYINVIFKYEEFELPDNMHLGKHFENNVEFYKKLPKSQGYKK